MLFVVVAVVAVCSSSFHLSISHDSFSSIKCNDMVLHSSPHPYKSTVEANKGERTPDNSGVETSTGTSLGDAKENMTVEESTKISRKRVADHQLTKEEYEANQDNDGETDNVAVGEFPKASAQVLQQRRIVRVPLKISQKPVGDHQLRKEEYETNQDNDGETDDVAVGNLCPNHDSFRIWEGLNVSGKKPYFPPHVVQAPEKYFRWLWEFVRLRGYSHSYEYFIESRAWELSMGSFLTICGLDATKAYDVFWPETELDETEDPSAPPSQDESAQTKDKKQETNDEKGCKEDLDCKPAAAGEKEDAIEEIKAMVYDLDRKQAAIKVMVSDLTVKFSDLSVKFSDLKADVAILNERVICRKKEKDGKPCEEDLDRKTAATGKAKDAIEEIAILNKRVDRRKQQAFVLKDFYDNLHDTIVDFRIRQDNQNEEIKADLKRVKDFLIQFGWTDAV